MKTDSNKWLIYQSNHIFFLQLKNDHNIFTMNAKKDHRKKNFFHHHQKRMEEEEEAEGRDMHQVPGIRDKVMSRHVGTSGPKSRQALHPT